MSGPLKVLILGRDPDLFASAEGAPNDTHQRHVLYVEELQRRRPGSEVRAIVHTRRPAGKRHEQPMPGFDIYGTFSRSRLHCPIDMARLMVAFDKEGVNRPIHLGLLLLLVLHAALDALDFAPNRGSGIFEISQVGFNLTDILVNYRRAVVLQRLVNHVMQVCRDERRNFV